MSDLSPIGTLLPSFRRVAAELSDDDLEALLLAGERESTKEYLSVLLIEYEERAKAVK